MSKRKTTTLKTVDIKEKQYDAELITILNDVFMAGGKSYGKRKRLLFVPRSWVDQDKWQFTMSEAADKLAQLPREDK